VTNQGVAKMPIFRDTRDMHEFLARFRNYLSPQRYVDSTRRPYVKLCDDVSLIGYCLMWNHFHLIFHQHTPNGMSELMRRAPVAYARYFNLRHGRQGPMFRSRFTAKPITTIEHAQSTIAYVHLNEVFDQLDYEFSSHKLFTGEKSCDWIDSERGLGVFGGLDGYKSFLNRRGPRLVAGKLQEMGLPADHSPYRPIR
jgi:REP element-mobilizing transposase RayT